MLKSSNLQTVILHQVNVNNKTSNNGHSDDDGLYDDDDGVDESFSTTNPRAIARKDEV